MRRSHRVMLVGAILFLAGTGERIRDEMTGAAILLSSAVLLFVVGAYLLWLEHD